MTTEEKARAFDEAYKTAENIHRFSSDLAEIKRMEQIFPKLKESEDERIRKALINQFNDYKRRGENHGFGYSNDKILAWLEKQGENANFFNKIQIGDKVTRNRDGVLVNLSQLNRVAKPAEKQGENSMGISETTKKKLEDNLNKALEKETSESWNKFLDGGDEQKPAWSEEDEVKINRIVACLENLNVADNDILLKDIDWLKSLKDRVQPQPKQEWSEEDEQYLLVCKNALAKYQITDKWDAYIISHWLENKLKSLRPQNNVTDKELAQAKKDAYNEVLDKIEYHSGEPTFDDGWSAAIWYLKKRNVQFNNTWKPSDEQMNALDSTLQYSQVSHNSFEHLNSLFNDLKKLKGE